jgi:hypothetical protein
MITYPFFRLDRNLIKKHFLMSEGISLYGLDIDSETGKLYIIVNEYNKNYKQKILCTNN